MNFFSRYGDYLKDNRKGLWFKRRLFGWGWFPARWQGWAVLLVFIAVLSMVVVSFKRIAAPSSTDIIQFIAEIVLLVVALVVTCYLTGESPRWSWGIP